MRIIQGQYNNDAVLFNGCEKDSEYLVDLAGYVPLQAQIMEMQLAGERLVQNQLDRYFQTDTLLEGEEADDMEPEITRRPGFEYADATRIYDDTMNAIQRHRTELALKDAEEKQKADTDSNTPQEASAPVKE